MASKHLSWMLEGGILSLFQGASFSSPISGILIIPPIIDKMVAPPPPDYIGYKKKDNSVSVGMNIDFRLWQCSSELQRLGLLVENIHSSLNMIQSRYLV